MAEPEGRAPALAAAAPEGAAAARVLAQGARLELLRVGVGDAGAHGDGGQRGDDNGGERLHVF